MTSGQVPALESEWLTTRLAAGVQVSAMVTPRATSSATVVAGAGAALRSHPCTVAGVRVPVMSGGVVSWMVIVWTVGLELLQASVTDSTLFRSSGQVPALESEWLTT